MATNIRSVRRPRRLSFNEGLARQLTAWAKEREREAETARKAARELRGRDA